MIYNGLMTDLRYGLLRLQGQAAVLGEELFIDRRKGFC